MSRRGYTTELPLMAKTRADPDKDDNYAENDQGSPFEPHHPNIDFESTLTPVESLRHDDVHPSVPSTSTSSKSLIIESNTRRVRKRYLSMIGTAYILTILSPGTSLWSSSSFSSFCNSEGEQQPLLRRTNSTYNDVTQSDAITESTLENDTIFHNSTAPTNQNSIPTIIGKCWYGSSIHIGILAQLTCSTACLIVLFFNLQASNPGRLTDDVMSRMDAAENRNQSGATLVVTNEGYSDCRDIEEMESEASLMEMEQQRFLEPLPPNLSSTPSHSKEGNANTTFSQHQSQKKSYNNSIQTKKSNLALYPHTRRKYCTSCQNHPPLRSHHCKHCNSCIATFDHHCDFLDTCIGERNHFRFWWFVLWNVICSKMALGIVNSTVGSRSSHGAGSNSSGLLALLNASNVDRLFVDPGATIYTVGQVILLLNKLYLYPIYFLATLLWIIHTTLALGNATTFEMTKGSEHVDYLHGTNTMDFPFGRGLWRNVGVFFARDDVCRWLMAWFATKTDEKLDSSHHRNRCKCCGSRNMCATGGTANIADRDWWMPIVWKMPEYIERESEDWWNHPWQNKYWSCC